MQSTRGEADPSDDPAPGSGMRRPGPWRMVPRPPARLSHSLRGHGRPGGSRCAVVCAAATTREPWPPAIKPRPGWRAQASRRWRTSWRRYGSRWGRAERLRAGSPCRESRVGASPTPHPKCGGGHVSA